jgi:hypothetical protein
MGIKPGMGVDFEYGSQFFVFLLRRVPLEHRLRRVDLLTQLFDLGGF